MICKRTGKKAVEWNNVFPDGRFWIPRARGASWESIYANPALEMSHVFSNSWLQAIKLIVTCL
jgi:hypothetical protein